MNTKEFDELLSRVAGGFDETEDSQEYHRHDIVMEALRQVHNNAIRASAEKETHRVIYNTEGAHVFKDDILKLLIP